MQGWALPVQLCSNCSFESKRNVVICFKVPSSGVIFMLSNFSFHQLCCLQCSLKYNLHIVKCTDQKCIVWSIWQMHIHQCNPYPWYLTLMKVNLVDQSARWWVERDWQTPSPASLWQPLFYCFYELGFFFFSYWIYKWYRAVKKKKGLAGIWQWSW